MGVTCKHTWWVAPWEARGRPPACRHGQRAAVAPPSAAVAPPLCRAIIRVTSTAQFAAASCLFPTVLEIPYEDWGRATGEKGSRSLCDGCSRFDPKSEGGGLDSLTARSAWPRRLELCLVGRCAERLFTVVSYRCRSPSRRSRCDATWPAALLSHPGRQRATSPRGHRSMSENLRFMTSRGRSRPTRSLSLEDDLPLRPGYGRPGSATEIYCGRSHATPRHAGLVCSCARAQVSPCAVRR